MFYISFLLASFSFVIRSTAVAVSGLHVREPSVQAQYPTVSASSCGSFALVNGVCCPKYCTSDDSSTTCSNTAACDCGSPSSSVCKSGTMYEQLTAAGGQPWRYSRSTHYGLTSGGACGFGLYGLCTKGSSTSSWTDPLIAGKCTAFCNAYPTLCKDPSGTTLRGNYAAPNGDYYSQFWNSLPGTLDNYLSCGECMEVVRTKTDGTDYDVGEPGYESPITLEITDSCPCNANSKWCCGPEADHCGEIAGDFKYGCPLPAGSIHMDLSDIAIGRLNGGGNLTPGLIPTRYRRVPCPNPGDMYIWLQDGAGAYYFALSVVNTAGVGSVTKVEMKAAGQTSWTPLPHHYHVSSRPQERYGAYRSPSTTKQMNLPIGLRITSASGQQVVNDQAITSWDPPSGAPAGYHYINLGVQFSA